jgi:hypothetical protein
MHKQVDNALSIQNPPTPITGHEPTWEATGEPYYVEATMSVLEWLFKLLGYYQHCGKPMVRCKKMQKEKCKTCGEVREREVGDWTYSYWSCSVCHHHMNFKEHYVD